MPSEEAAKALQPILTELLAREPIFHQPKFAATPDDFARMMASDYWEIGASGRRYDRNFILEALTREPPADAAEAGWQIFASECRRLSQTTYLLTYTLHQGERRTRRATLWQSTSTGWQILYHQGTIISVTEVGDPPPG